MRIGGMVLCGANEPYLEYCLLSICDIVDEISIICPEEALQLTENVCQIVGCQDKTSIEVQNTEEINFASWRNQSLKVLDKCSHIFFIDADEVLANPDGSLVKRKDFHNIVDSRIGFFTYHFIYNYFTIDGRNNGNHFSIDRLFDKRLVSGYVNKVHESLNFKGHVVSKIASNPIIFHFGHCKGMENLANRYRERHIKENPFTGKMNDEEFNNHLRTHNILRGTLPLIAYHGPLPKVMNLW